MLYWGGRMEFLLNERSLHGQFESTDDFLKSLKPVMNCINIIRAYSDMEIYKIRNFHECHITKEKKICDLKLCGNSDELLRLKLKLDQEIYQYPYWDEEPIHDISLEFLWGEENITATSLAEAAVTGNSLLSFQSSKFQDCELKISSQENGNKNNYHVFSVHTPKYLLKNFHKLILMDKKQMLIVRYEDTRIDCTTLEEEHGVSILEKDEFAELLSTLDKFVNHVSWESIGLDDGLEYKKYSPSSPKDNWFRSKKYEGKTIMKFRFSRVLRCYGYRKGDKFKVLRLERDHSISNHG